MYATSNKWKRSIYENVQPVLNVYIDEVLVNPNYILDFKMGGTLFDEELELGSTPSQYVEMKIHNKSGIQNPQIVKVEYGILVSNAYTVAEVNAMLVGTLNGIKVKSLSKKNKGFEIIPMGIYNVDDYTDDDGNTFTIKASDNVIKLDADEGYYDGSEIINEKGYATLKEVAQDICSKKGVELRNYFFFK